MRPWPLCRCGAQYFSALFLCECKQIFIALNCELICQPLSSKMAIKLCCKLFNCAKGPLWTSCTLWGARGRSFENWRWKNIYVELVWQRNHVYIIFTCMVCKYIYIFMFIDCKQLSRPQQLLFINQKYSKSIIIEDLLYMCVACVCVCFKYCIVLLQFVSVILLIWRTAIDAFVQRVCN